MTYQEFEKHVDEMQRMSIETLKVKNKEYAAGDDVLHNFKTAAELQGITPAQALEGMMAKHTISIYDMINMAAFGRYYPKEMWAEKIKDNINYLYLLWAMICEKLEGRGNDQNLSDL